MKKLLIELNQIFEIDLEKEDLEQLQSFGVDTNNPDEIYFHLEEEIKGVIDTELDIYRSSWISLEEI